MNSYWSIQKGIFLSWRLSWIGKSWNELSQGFDWQTSIITSCKLQQVFVFQVSRWRHFPRMTYDYGNIQNISNTQHSTLKAITFRTRKRFFVARLWILIIIIIQGHLDYPNYWWLAWESVIWQFINHKYFWGQVWSKSNFDHLIFIFLF